ncbi:MAG: hypothetical protein LAO51_18135 [Acidobacteriia bacterium]|nr:hypothetical protein [Terriglobia bacterium]
MAKDSGPEPASPAARSAVGAPRTALALGAAWLLPGLGHVVLGHVRRGLLFTAIVMGSFALGMAHDGRLALRDGRQAFLTTLQVVANVGVGPADLLARLAVYGEPAYAASDDGVGGAFESRVVRIFRERSRSGVSAYGTAYLWTAGLMNLLLLFDVWDIARGRKD